MRKLILIISFLAFISATKAQWFNRAYFNISAGYHTEGEMGLYAHVFDHFSVGFNSGVSSIKTGPGYQESGFSLLSLTKHHKNEYQTKNFFAGVTTSRFERFDASFMFGPAWISGRELYNFKKQASQYSNDEYYSFDRKYVKTVGIVLRAEALFEINEVFGINVSCQQQLNSARNFFSVVVGINIGIVRDINSY